jgi:hypothetical protein
LESERGRLVGEIRDVCAGFDAQVAQLRGLRLHASLAVATQALYSLRLGVGLAAGEAVAAEAAALHGSLAKLQAQKADLDAQADRWHAQVDAAKASLQALADEDSKLEKGCRKQLQDAAGEGNALPNDVVRHLLKLFNLRRAPPSQAEKGGEKPGRGRRTQTTLVKKAKPSLLSAAGMMVGARREQKSGGGFLGLLKQASKEDEAKKLADLADPFSALQDAEDAASSGAPGSDAAKKKALDAAAAEASQLAPLNEQADLPEGVAVPPLVWARLNELRLAKVKVELEAKAQAKLVQEMRRATDSIDKRDRAIAREVAAVTHQLAELDRQAADNARDFELLCCLASGQNEMVEFNGLPSRYAAEVALEEAAAVRAEKKASRRRLSSSPDGTQAARLDRVASTASNLGYQGGASRIDPQVSASSYQGAGREDRVNSSASSFGEPSHAHGAAARDLHATSTSSGHFGGGASPAAGGAEGGEHAHGVGAALGVGPDMEPLLAAPLGGGVLLAVAALEALNAQVQAAGLEKVKAMQRIKAFRKHLNLMAWEDTFRAAKLQDLEEFYSDLLLLRVEKSALAAMRGEGKVLEAAEATERSVARLAVADRAALQRQATVQKAVDKLSGSVRERRAEIGRLAGQLRELEAAVGAREAI